MHRIEIEERRESLKYKLREWSAVVLFKILALVRCVSILLSRRVIHAILFLPIFLQPDVY